ncbi:MAG: prolyl oligopeptidase family serine peptidase, partial [Acidobacteria bacterium]|nr:prolyl oligopeptidase family serine peptidase [Acidobacteriota bacterium]
MRFVIVILFCGLCLAQAPPGPIAPVGPSIPPSPAPPGPRGGPGGERDHQHDLLMKTIDDLLWYQKLGDVAEVDKVRFTGPPPRYIPNPTGQGAGNPLIIPAYTFIPKKLDQSKKHPVLVLVHGGVHANFSSSAANVVRELVELGYPVIAPEYRGSTGYGGEFYRQIDYGDRENDDVFAARNWMLE